MVTLRRTEFSLCIFEFRVKLLKNKEKQIVDNVHNMVIEFEEQKPRLQRYEKHPLGTQKTILQLDTNEKYLYGV